jgi:hypothetical protein
MLLRLAHSNAERCSGRKFYCDPDGVGGFLAGGVGEKLPEVIVVSRAELVLHDDEVLSPSDLGDKVYAERADGDLGRHQLEVEADPFGQVVEVLGEPRREVPALRGPDLLDREPLEFAERRVHLSPCGRGDRRSSLGDLPLGYFNWQR